MTILLNELPAVSPEQSIYFGCALCPSTFSTPTLLLEHHDRQHSRWALVDYTPKKVTKESE